MKDIKLFAVQSKSDLAGRCVKILAEKYGQALHEGSDNPLLQFGNPFLAAALETVRGIVEPSIRRRNLRVAMANSGVEVPLSSVKPGAVLLVGLAVVLEHSGVYLGDGMTAELHGSGEICQVNFEQFRVGRDSDKMKLRSGDRIYVACSLSGDEGLSRFLMMRRQKRRESSFDITFHIISSSIIVICFLLAVSTICKGCLLAKRLRPLRISRVLSPVRTGLRFIMFSGCP